MFYKARSFNQSLNNWNVSNVTNMRWMFEDARSFNQPLNNWNVSNVKYMGAMFQGARSFNQPLNNWNVSNVRNMKRMFAGATSFNQPLNNWSVSLRFVTIHSRRKYPITNRIFKSFCLVESCRLTRKGIDARHAIRVDVAVCVCDF